VLPGVPVAGDFRRELDDLELGLEPLHVEPPDVDAVEDASCSTNTIISAFPPKGKYYTKA
jgi:hypothetical protein